jgi:hypothetical protein
MCVLILSLIIYQAFFLVIFQLYQTEMGQLSVIKRTCILIYGEAV